MVRKSETRREFGPERLAGQGLDVHQYESGDRTILALLAETPAADQVDLVATWRDDSYEVWSRRGMLRFKRFADESGALSFRGRGANRRKPNRKSESVHRFDYRQKNWTPPSAAATRPTTQSQFLRAARAQPSLCVRTNRAALRQPARAGSRRQPQGLCVRNSGRAARRARRRAIPRAARVQRSRCARAGRFS